MPTRICEPTRISLRAAFAAAALYCAGAGEASAQDARVVLIGNVGPGEAGQPRSVPEIGAALTARGIPVEEYQPADADELVATLAGLRGSDLVLYVAGEVAVTGAGATLVTAEGAVDPRLALQAVLERLADAGTRRVTLLIETCPRGGPVPAIRSPRELDLALAVSRSAGTSCPLVGRRITDRLLAALGQGTGPAEIGSILAAVVPAVGDGTGRGTLEPPELPDFPPAPVVYAKLDRPAGVERPSIIIGLIPTTPAPEQPEATAPEPQVEPEDPPAPAEPPPAETASAPSYDWTDTELRQSARRADPARYADEVRAGYYDPPDPELVTALQTELKRLNCYRLGIDGDWGRRSREAVQTYFAQIAGVESPGDEPSRELWQAIIVREDVRCPDPPRTSATANNGGGGGNSGGRSDTKPRGSSSEPRPQPEPEPQPQPQPQPQPLGIDITSNL